jgi:hypothetical protein
MIADKWYLTAQHCVLVNAGANPGSAAIAPSHVSVYGSDGTAHQGVAFVQHPTLDVVLVQLASSVLIDGAIVTSPLWSGSTSASVGQLTCQGFGYVDSRGTSNPLYGDGGGTLRTAIMTPK